MNSNRRKYLLPVCILCVAAVLSGCTGKKTEEEHGILPEAAPSQALSAYQEILKAAPAIEGQHEELFDASFGPEQNRELFGDHYDSYSVYDVDRDGVQELIASSVVNFRWTTVSVFRLEDGKAVLLKAAGNENGNGSFEQNSAANGAYTTYICGNNHIHSLWRGMTPVGEAEENHAYALNGGTLTEVACPSGEGEAAVRYPDIAKANTAENRKEIA